MALNRVSGKAKYFLREGWTSGFWGREVICPSGKSVVPIVPLLTLLGERSTIKNMRFEILG
jgi:hypothetical protein